MTTVIPGVAVQDAAATHVVTNQVPPLLGHDVFDTDLALREAVERHLPRDAQRPPALDALSRLGRLAGSEQARRWGAEANEQQPRLRTHDRYGHRIDEVEYAPAWHDLLRVAVGSGLHAAPWTSAQPGAHVVRAAGFLVWSQVEAGHGCPISMTYAAVRALRHDPALAATWLPRLASTTYEPGLRPPGSKAGCLAGMAMTEKQGGSDVRAVTTTAVPAGDGAYALTGHKWFCSAPMSDVFLVLAQAPGGLTCFVVPRVLDDGTRNVWRLQRLKDKLGNRSNASSEVEMAGTWAQRLGEEGRGVATILDMVAMTRLDCALGSAALMREAVAQATHHAAHRRAFGRLLADSPLMQAVLADLAVESEAATALAMRLAATVDSAEHDLARLGLPLAKYWITKRAIAVAAEALECLGGNGYVEESGLPRVYREAPVNSVWEGSGNVNALDLLRALHRSPAAGEAYLAEVRLARGGDPRLDAAMGAVEGALRGDLAEAGARAVAERLAVVLQASLLVRYAPAAVADAFCATRLQGVPATFGASGAAVDVRAVLGRATPHLP